MDWDTDEEQNEIAPPPADIGAALAALTALGNPERAALVAKRQKIDREVLGCELPDLSALAGEWRSGMTLGQRLEMARALWQSGIFEARIMAAKLLTQARIRPDDSAVWAMLASWVPEFDSIAIADQVARAAERRIVADPSRLDDVAAWLESDNPWQRRAALVFTLPWTRLAHPKPADREILAKLLIWAESLSEDGARLVQQALAMWLRELSRRDPEMTRSFLLAHGRKLPVFARLEAAQLLAEPVVYDLPEEEGDDGEDEDFDDEDIDDDDL